MPIDKQLATSLYRRIRADSGGRISATKAAALVAETLGTSPLMIGILVDGVLDDVAAELSRSSPPR